MRPSFARQQSRRGGGERVSVGHHDSKGACIYLLFFLGVTFYTYKIIKYIESNYIIINVYIKYFFEIYIHTLPVNEGSFD